MFVLRNTAVELLEIIIGQKIGKAFQRTWYRLGGYGFMKIMVNYKTYSSTNTVFNNKWEIVDFKSTLAEMCVFDLVIRCMTNIGKHFVRLFDFS